MNIMEKITSILLSTLMLTFFIIIFPFLYLIRLFRNLRLPLSHDKELLLSFENCSEAETKTAILAGAKLSRWYSTRQLDYVYGRKSFFALFSPLIIFDDLVTPLIAAIIQPTPCIGCIVLMLERGASPFDRNPLIYAVRSDQPEILNLLIRYGALANIADNRLWNPLFEAICENNTAMATVLLEHGIDPNQTSDDVGTPLLFALSFADIDPVIIEELLYYGADTRKVNSNGKTALDLAHESGNETIIALLER